MNPLVRHFLPSVIRGVYRFDNEFSAVRSAEDYAEFIDTKFQFLPGDVRELIRAKLSPTEDFEAAKARLELPEERLGSTADSRIRAYHFYKDNLPYFAEAIEDKKAIENSNKFLEIQFVERILAPLLKAEGLRAVKPQLAVGRFRIDFAIEGEAKLALETDGRSKFVSREDFDNFLDRQNFLTTEGWKVIRYSYAHVMLTTAITRNKLYAIFNADKKLRRYLGSDPHPRPCLIGRSRR